jgi:hypothetical protein
MPSSFTGDSGLGGGSVLIIQLVSPSPSSRLQEFPSSKGLRGGRYVL